MAWQLGLLSDEQASGHVVVLRREEIPLAFGLPGGTAPAAHGVGSACMRCTAGRWRPGFWIVGDFVEASALPWLKWNQQLPVVRFDVRTEDVAQCVLVGLEKTPNMVFLDGENRV